MSDFGTLLASTFPSLLLDIDHGSAATEARRVVASIASTAGLDETQAGAASIIVNELTTNLLKHAKEGVLFVQGARDHLDLIAIDRGPGLGDISAAMRDGYSSAGTAGNGLGAVRRLATVFDIHSTAGKGTAVLARIVGRRSETVPAQAPMRIGAFWRSMHLDDLCGDACAIFERGNDVVCLLADGLGHGVSASEASRAAVVACASATTLEPARLMERMHAALKPTRGAAVAVAVIDRAQRGVRFAGIGNIAASIRLEHESKSLVSLNGIVGHQVRSIQEFRYEWRPGSMLVLHSDGLTSRWTMDQEPGLSRKDPAIIAAVLARDFARDHDDRCVLILKENNL